MSYDSFRDAYNALKSHADTLRNQQERNIDELLYSAQDSVAAYKVC